MNELLFQGAILFAFGSALVWVAVAVFYRSPARNPNGFAKTYYTIAWETRDGVNVANYAFRERAAGKQNELHAKGVASQMTKSQWLLHVEDVSFMPGVSKRDRKAAAPAKRTAKIVPIRRKVKQ